MILSASGAFGNAATRIEAFVAACGAYVYGSHPDIDGLFREQAAELDRARREAILHRIQQLIHEKVLVAPIWLNAGVNGVGLRVEEPGFGLVAGYAFCAPYEDLKLKPKQPRPAGSGLAIRQDVAMQRPDPGGASGRGFPP